MPDIIAFEAQKNAALLSSNIHPLLCWFSLGCPSSEVTTEANA
jgi:hypothetical protein